MPKSEKLWELQSFETRKQTVWNTVASCRRPVLSEFNLSRSFQVHGNSFITYVLCLYSKLSYVVHYIYGYLYLIINVCDLLSQKWCFLWSISKPLFLKLDITINHGTRNDVSQNPSFLLQSTDQRFWNSRPRPTIGSREGKEGGKKGVLGRMARKHLWK